MLIDTHAHVNFSAFKDDGDEVVKRALKENIWMINVGSQIDTSRRAVEYAQKYPEGVFAAVGLHPIHLTEKEVAENDEYEKIEFKASAEKFDYEQYKTLAQDSKVVAIGEVGLDYYHISNSKFKIQKSKFQVKSQNLNELKETQRKVLSEQIALAQEFGKPIIFHCREAHNDLLEILKGIYYNNSPQPSLILREGDPPLRVRGGEGELRGVIHSFSGRWSQAEQYLEMGFYLGFNGIITFARDYDRVIKEMPLEQLLIETDCPYLTPIPFRGKRNEPSYVKYVAEKVAEIRGITYNEVAEATTKNAKKLFGI